MLSYQHGYHAGNFADVVKHTTLSRLLHYLTQKDKPLLYLETHSGRGAYDLKNAHSLKTAEFKEGIEALWAQKNQLPDVFSLYIKAIKQINAPDTLRYYPGSPQLAIDALRSIDRLFFSELHPQEFDHLSQLLKLGKRVFYSDNDGLYNLAAQLPPMERRGLIFIDPSYEIKSEYRDIPIALKKAYDRFATGVYCIWYPLVDNKLHQQLLRGLTQIGATNNLKVEFYMSSREKPGMTGCGLWIINPPYLLADELKVALQALRNVFNPGVLSYLIESI